MAEDSTAWFDERLYAAVAECVEGGKPYPRRAIDRAPFYLPRFQDRGLRPFDALPCKAIAAWVNAWRDDSRTRLFIPEVLLTYEEPLRWFMVGEGVARDAGNGDLMTWQNAREGVAMALRDICANQAKLAQGVAHAHGAALSWIAAHDMAFSFVCNVSDVAVLTLFYNEMHGHMAKATDEQYAEMRIADACGIDGKPPDDVRKEQREGGRKGGQATQEQRRNDRAVQERKKDIETALTKLEAILKVHDGVRGNALINGCRHFCDWTDKAGVLHRGKFKLQSQGKKYGEEWLSLMNEHGGPMTPEYLAKLYRNKHGAMRTRKRQSKQA